MPSAKLTFCSVISHILFSALFLPWVGSCDCLVHGKLISPPEQKKILSWTIFHQVSFGQRRYGSLQEELARRKYLRPLTLGCGRVNSQKETPVFLSKQLLLCFFSNRDFEEETSPRSFGIGRNLKCAAICSYHR